MKNLAACHFMGDVFEYITWEYYQVAEGDRKLYCSIFFEIIIVMRFGAVSSKGVSVKSFAINIELYQQYQ